MTDWFDRLATDARLDTWGLWLVLVPAGAFLILGLAVAGGTILRLW